MLKNPNMLELRFQRKPEVPWRLCEDGLVEVTLVHKGFFATVAQKVFQRPSQSEIKLDELGSFVWQALETYDSIPVLAEVMQAQFGAKAEPTVPRLAKFCQLLLDNGLLEKKHK